RETKEIVIRKIQPRQECESRLDVVRLLQEFRERIPMADPGTFIRGEDVSSIRAAYLDTDETTMIGLSESHQVRRRVHDAFGFLPRSQAVTLRGRIKSWLGPMNILWKKLSPEEQAVREGAGVLLR